jgi:hypothetical protein
MRRKIAIYDRSRLLVKDLCEVNGDEWVIGSILNVADVLRLLLDLTETGAGSQLARVCTSEYCIEIEATKEGFTAYEVRL